MEFQAEAVETVRQLTLQIMLIAAGVFGIVGGFVSSSEKVFVRRSWLGISLAAFSATAIFGYLLHGVMISMLSAERFDAFNGSLVTLGILQIASFVGGGIAFTVFVVANIGR
ncbi:MAG: hypothetical protein M9939_02765 [Mesorhizobium sp.]|nr:hypothetical protein [Mesorhizobium sp.]MCO5160031.1 hypothetical protein [Mesorhizobium sp.]